MNTIDQLRTGMGRAWGSLAEGWKQLRERTTHALTHFHPLHRNDTDVEEYESLVEKSASRWGLLAADVLENHNDVVVKIEAPGLEPQNFDISVMEDYLVVRGEKHVQKESREGRYHMLECAYGAFERTVALPARVDENGASANYRHGILRITLPKQSAPVRPRINVKVSES